MSAEVFLDSNVIAYAFDETAPAKAGIAKDILWSNNWCISWQVIQEFTSVALYKFVPRLEPEDLADYNEIVLWPSCKIHPTTAVHRSALDVLKQTQYRFYDCLIIASAIETGAKTLYTEDMQHGRRISDLEIVNPFL